MRRYFAVTLAFCAVIACSPIYGQSMLVSTDWLQANLHKVKVIEIGDRDTYNAGHIPGASLVAFSSLVTDVNGVPAELPPIDRLETVFRDAGAGDSRQVVLYSHDPLHAARAWFTLDYLGHGYRTSILDGGYAKWSAEGRTISTVAVLGTPALFQAKVNAAAVTRLEAMRQLVRERDAIGPALVVIDARPVAQFTGHEPGAGVKTGGHIPGAVNISWPENFTGGSTPVFRSTADLRAMYESVGVTKASANIVYCRTGIQASVAYFALKYIGYDAMLYDGSFTEWSASGQTIE